MSQHRIGSGEYLVLLGGAQPAAPTAWLHFDASRKNVLKSGRNCGDGFAGATPARTILIIPAAEAQLKRLEIAARTGAQARAAAPYLFEGALAAAQQELHYAIGASQDEAGDRLVAAIDASRLTEWIEAHRAIGAEPGAVVLDCTIWPTSAGAVDVIETPQFTIVAGGLDGGFSIEPMLAPMLFARWLAAARSRIETIRLSVADPPAWTNALGAGQRLAHFVPCIDNPEEELARGALAAPDYAPDLRQGAFAPAAAGGQQPWRLWRFAAALALLALALQIGGLVVAGLRDAQAAQRTLALAERDFRAARPEVRRIVNLRAQVAALVNATEQAGDHPVLAAADPLIRVLQAHPLVRLDEVRHAAPGRTVHLRLSSPQGPALEAAIAEIGRQGLRTEARGLQPIEGRYTTELVLESP